MRQFGRIVNIKSEPGLYMKTPFVQSIQRVSAATILYDVPASDVITRDKKSMISDNYILWRVTEPTKYIQTLNAIEGRAEERIEAAVYNSLKKIISGMTQRTPHDLPGGSEYPGRPWCAVPDEDNTVG